jgi:hypothetical protein
VFKYLIISFVFISSLGIAQQRYKSQDLGIYLGASYYLGDINPQGHFLFSKPSFGGIFRQNMNRRFSFKSSLIVGFIGADDKVAFNAWQQNRNLSFKSIISEFSGQFEFNFFPYESGSDQYRYSPYVFAGLSVFYFNPWAYEDGGNAQIYLQPLRTENKKYTLIQPSIPFGVGYKWNIAGKVTLALEWGVRKTFTDYIDDVSTVYIDPTILTQQHGSLSAAMSNRTSEIRLDGMQRGDSKHKDWYAFAGILLTYTIKAHTSCPVY